MTQLTSQLTQRFLFILIYFIYFFSGNRRPRTRNRGQLLAKTSKATTLEFDSDFDFETANAQFKDDLKKETERMCFKATGHKDRSPETK